MHRLDTSIEIAVPTTRVWSVLVDFPSYPRWNPFVRSIAGNARVGERLVVQIQPPGQGGMRFRPVVLKAEAGRELRWKGKVLLPGLFDGEHYFVLEPAGRGTLFRHGELFSGLLVPLFRKSLDGATRAGFLAMNEALKREAEKKPA
jgi:hypothetical protein